MNGKDVAPYLDIIAKVKPGTVIYYYQSPDNKRYEIYFYNATEFATPCVFVCIGQINKQTSYYTIMDNQILWDKDCKLSDNVKSFAGRLVNLFSFM